MFTRYCQQAHSGILVGHFNPYTRHKAKKTVSRCRFFFFFTFTSKKFNMFRIAVFTLLLSSAAQLVAKEIRTSCVIRGHREGPGTLTCQFGVDLNVSKTSFAVQRYGLDSHNTEPDDVLLGVWYARDQMDYYVHDGYAFDRKVSNTIVIRMSSITPDYEGRYRCHVIPNNVKLVEECVLNISDLQPPLPPSTSTRSLDHTIKGDSSKDDEDYPASSAPGVIAGAVVRGLSIAALTAVVTRLR